AHTMAPAAAGDPLPVLAAEAAMLPAGAYGTPGTMVDLAAAGMPALQVPAVTTIWTSAPTPPQDTGWGGWWAAQPPPAPPAAGPNPTVPNPAVPVAEPAALDQGDAPRTSGSPTDGIARGDPPVPELPAQSPFAAWPGVPLGAIPAVPGGSADPAAGPPAPADRSTGTGDSASTSPSASTGPSENSSSAGTAPTAGAPG